MITHTFLHRHTIVALIFIPLAGWVASNVPFFQHNLTQNAPIQYRPPFFKLVTIGQWPAAVELMWITLLQMENPEAMIRFYDLATDLDPYFYELYEQAAVYFAFYQEDGKTAEHFLEKGLQVYRQKVLHQSESFQRQFWFHPYSLAIYLAYTEAFVLQDWKKARVAFLEAAEIPRAPRYLKEMQSWLKESGSETKLAVKVLKVMIVNTKDEAIQNKLKEKLQRLEGKG